MKDVELSERVKVSTELGVSVNALATESKNNAKIDNANNFAFILL